MPTSTARHRFEFRMLEWAETLSKSLCGERRAMFVGLRADGAVRRVYFAVGDETYEGERKNALAESHANWFLFTPHGETGSGYLEWFELDRRIAERWVGRKLVPEDFLDVRGTGARADWPTSWRVMIA